MVLSLYERSKMHKVELIFADKKYYFKVYSGKSKEEYDVIIELRTNCTCRYQSVKGLANNGVCSHIIASLRSFVENYKNDK